MSRKFFALEESGLSLGTEGELEAEDVVEASEASEEVAVDAEEVDALATAIEDAEVAASNLEEVAEVLEEGVESGEGVSEETAAAAEIAVEACLNMLGASHRRRSLMPSLESWGSGRSRLSSTKIALEGVVDKIKDIWRKIKEFVAATYQKVKDFISNLFVNAEKVKKAISKARESVNKKTNDEPKESTLKNKTISDVFNNGEGKADLATATAVLSNLSKLTENPTRIVKAAETLMDGIATANPGTIDTKARVFLSNTLVAVNADDVEDGSGSDKKTGKATPYLYQGKRIFIYTEKGEGAEANVVKKVGMRVLDPKKPNKEAAPLKKAECISLLTAADALMDSVITFKKVSKDIDSLVKAVETVANVSLKIMDTQGKANTSESSNDGYESGSLSTQRSMVTSLTSTCSRYFTMLPAWSVRAGNTAVSYVLASVSNWKDDKK